MSTEGQFTLIVVRSDEPQRESAAAAFASQFSLDMEVAHQVLKGAPIVFITELSKAEVRAITPALQAVSKFGVEFRLTLMTPNKLPRVNWPIRPQFTAAGSGGPHAAAFEWDNNAFVCPSCGETFLFRRLGKLPLATEVAAKAAPAPAKAEAPRKPDSKASLPAATAGLAAAKSEPAPAGALDLDLAPPGEMALDLGGEGLDLGAALEEAVADTKPEKKKKEAPPPAKAEAPAAPAVEAKEDEISLDAALGDGLLSSEDALKDDAGVPDVSDALAPGEEAYNVFVSQIKDKEKRDEVAKIVAQARKCSMDEAKQMTTRAMFKAADNVPKPKADAILTQLKKLKVSARMTKAAAGG